MLHLFQIRLRTFTKKVQVTRATSRSQHSATSQEPEGTHISDACSPQLARIEVWCGAEEARGKATQQSSALGKCVARDSSAYQRVHLRTAKSLC
jgi:hypothetical protein